MIAFEEAIILAKKLVYQLRSDTPLEILKGSTIEFEFGWVFFYQSRAYVMTGDFTSLVGGNAPILIDKESGNAFVTGTSHDSDYYINKYCTLRKHPEKLKDFFEEISIMGGGDGNVPD
jgi:hypothetical protein